MTEQIELTEALIKWASERVPQSEYSDLSHADHWIRAFCAEVEKLADKWKHPGIPQNPAEPVFNSFNALKRELLGE